MKIDLIKKPVTRKAKLLGLLLAVLVIGAGAVYWFVLKDSGSGVSKEFQAESEAIFEAMKQSEVRGGLDPSRTAEVHSSINNKDYAGAKKQIESLLTDPNLTDADKRNLYTSLAQVCLPLKDFSCVDTVAGQYGGVLQPDYFFLVDAARLANQEKKPDLARKYYKTAFDDIETKGGQTFVDSVNQQGLEKELNYTEIKQGAGA